MGEPVVKKRLSDKPYCFIALPHSNLFNDTEATIRAVVEGGYIFSQNFDVKKLGNRSIKVLLARYERFIGQGICKICQLCWFSDFAVAELGTLNPNVMIEIGWLMGLGKKIIFTLHKAYMSIKEIPFDLGNPMLITYANTMELSNNLEDKVNFLLLTSLAREGQTA